MSPLFLAAAVTAAAGMSWACSGEDEPAGPSGQLPPGEGGTSGATGGTSGTGGSGTGGDGTAGSGTAGESTGGNGTAGDGTGGSGTGGDGTGGITGGGAGGEPGAECGNGVAEPGEDCDQDDFAAGVDCQRFGFDDGTLSCSSDCTANTDSCSGKEDCFDGRDNDGDGLVDCVDADDCSSACSDPCSGVPVLSDPGATAGMTSGSANLTDASCSDSPSGPERIYELVAANTGMLDVEITTSQQLTVSVRTTCSAPGTELGCSLQRLSVPVTTGQTVYLVVEGAGAADTGQFSLEAASRPANVCGDGFLDPAEQCEDENTDPGDGCDENCQLESDETEPNDTVAEAYPLGDLSTPFYAQISPEGDVDVYEVTVAADGFSSMRVNTYNVGIGMCALGLMDSFIEILDTNGTWVLTSDDDGGDGLCARAATFALAADTYYIRVRASDYATPDNSTFPYRLGVSVDVCGNGVVAAGEECDDGNVVGGDGCSVFCRNQ